jgi:TRAP-type uncharacterized transport system, periplasmic component
VKRVLRLLAVSCVLLGLLGGSALAATTFINIGTGSTGGTYYPVGAAMCKIWNDAIPGLKASAQSTGGTVHNLQLMGNKEAERGASWTGFITLPTSARASTRVTPRAT